LKWLEESSSQGEEVLDKLENAGDLLSKLLTSEARAELLILFHQNPGLIDTREAVARRIGRTSGEVEADLNELISIGILGNKMLGRREVIFLNRARDKEVQALLSKHIDAGGG
jgi:predicted transcriptional regulator